MKRQDFLFCSLLVFLVLPTQANADFKSLDQFHLLETEEIIHKRGPLGLIDSTREKFHRPEETALHNKEPEATERKGFVLNKINRHILTSFLMLFAGFFCMVIYVEILEPKLRKTRFPRE